MDIWYQNIITTAGTVVSLIGFYLLYLTFKLQSETFKSQLSVTQIELNKFLFSIRPEFSLECDYNPSQHVGQNFIHYGTVIQLFLSKQIALEVECNFYELANPSRCHKQHHAIMGINDSLITTIYHDLQNDYNPKIFGIIIFKDEIGTRYQQTLSGRFPYIKLLPPIRVDSKI